MSNATSPETVRRRIGRTGAAAAARWPLDGEVGRKALDVVATCLSFGTNKLFRRGSRWLRRNGLVRYILPALLVNEAFGAYRAYLAGGAMGLW